jgi:hypothetical protein
MMASTIIENLDLEKPSFGPSKWPSKLKTTKNSKLPKLPENCFEPVEKGGWPPISTWIRNCRECKMKNQKIKKPRHIASEEKVRMFYFSPGSPYIPREPFILHIFNSSSKGEEVFAPR